MEDGEVAGQVGVGRCRRRGVSAVVVKGAGRPQNELERVWQAELAGVPPSNIDWYEEALIEAS